VLPSRFWPPRPLRTHAHGRLHGRRPRLLAWPRTPTHRAVALPRRPLAPAKGHLFGFFCTHTTSSMRHPDLATVSPPPCSPASPCRRSADLERAVATPRRAHTPHRPKALPFGPAARALPPPCLAITWQPRSPPRRRARRARDIGDISSNTLAASIPRTHTASLTHTHLATYASHTGSDRP